MEAIVDTLNKKIKSLKNELKAVQKFNLKQYGHPCRKIKDINAMNLQEVKNALNNDYNLFDSWIKIVIQ
jgi:hypothetical protein